MLDQLAFLPAENIEKRVCRIVRRQDNRSEIIMRGRDREVLPLFETQEPQRLRRDADVQRVRVRDVQVAELGFEDAMVELAVLDDTAWRFFNCSHGRLLLWCKVQGAWKKIS